MPELPEVETTRRGIAPHLQGRRIARVIVRQPRLRWPVPRNINSETAGATVQAVQRRGKYLLLTLDGGTLILHLGMSGSLQVLAADTPAGKHDHLDIVLSDGRCLRLHDPRRFGAVLWTRQDPQQHKLLAQLGPEPLSAAFDAACLYASTRKRHCDIKSLIMNSQIVVGVGNIYACEALFLAGIRPSLRASRLSAARSARLVDAIKDVLRKAIAAGGTTLRDFTDSDGRPGYFKQQLQVYGREGQPCVNCGHPVKRQVSGGRSTFYCAHCQR